MILYGSPMGDPNIHNHRRCPLLLLGGANGELAGNIHMKAPDGTPMANVFLNVMHKLGFDEMSSFGDSTGGVQRAEFGVDRSRRGKSVTLSRETVSMKKRLHVNVLAALAVSMLFTSADAPDSPLADAAMKGDAASVRVLLARGADVNAARGDGMTALHWAAETSNAEIADILVNAGAIIEVTTRLGAYTPLHVAGRKGAPEVIRVLLDAGANPRALAATGSTPLHLAAGAGSAEGAKHLLGRWRRDRRARG